MHGSSTTSENELVRARVFGLVACSKLSNNSVIDVGGFCIYVNASRCSSSCQLHVLMRICFPSLSARACHVSCGYFDVHATGPNLTRFEWGRQYDDPPRRTICGGGDTLPSDTQITQRRVWVPVSAANCCAARPQFIRGRIWSSMYPLVKRDCSAVPTTRDGATWITRGGRVPCRARCRPRRVAPSQRPDAPEGR